MTINYLSGGRIQGLTTDTKPSNVQNYSTWEEIDSEKIYTYYKDIPVWKKTGSAPTGGWKELGRTTLGSAGDTISITGLENNRYIMLLHHTIASGSTVEAMIFNNDSGSNYTRRISINGGADATNVSQTTIGDNIGSTELSEFGAGFISNYSTKEKFLIKHVVGQGTSTGSGTAPNRLQLVGKWANTADNINRIDLIQQDSGDFAIGSEVVVLGWDPANTHTTNFWQELANVNLSGGASATLSSGTFTAKKYLWWQLFLEYDTTQIPVLRFNADSGSNYADRGSNNGGADFTNVSQTGLGLANFQTYNTFTNGFTINNSANEKLSIINTVIQNTAGVGTAPQRQEDVLKWANTSNQITSIDISRTGSGNFGTKSFIKVWGAN